MWGAAAILEAAFLAALCWRKEWSWPSLMAFLAALSVRDLVLLYASIIHFGLLFWWAYYIGSLVADVCELWLLLEVGEHLAGRLAPTCARARSWVVYLFMGVTIVTLVCALLDESTACEMLERVCKTFDLSVSFGLTVALVSLYACAIFAGVQFVKSAGTIALGLLFEVALTGVVALLAAQHNPHKHAVAYVKSVQFIATLICWILPFLSQFGRVLLPHFSYSAFSRGARATQ